MAEKNVTLRALIEGALYDLIPKGSVYNIWVDENTTLAAKLAEVINSLNGKVTNEQLAEAVANEVNQYMEEHPVSGGESGPKYGKLVVFGDSQAAGYNNNNYSFVNALSESGAFSSVVGHSKAGATIGPYQTDSNASGYSLTEQIEKYASDVRNADIIMLEYGNNDLNAVIAGKVSMGTKEDSSSSTTVCGYLKKAVDRIIALNPDVRIVWLSYLWADREYADLSLGVDYWHHKSLFELQALQGVVYKLSGIVTMEGFSSSDVASDGAHHNNQGHQHAASQILHKMFDMPSFGQRYIAIPATINSTGTSITIPDAQFGTVFQLLLAGAEVVIIAEASGASVRIPCAVLDTNTPLMQFSAVTLGTNNAVSRMFVVWEFGKNPTLYLK